MELTEGVGEREGGGGEEEREDEEEERRHGLMGCMVGVGTWGRGKRYDRKGVREVVSENVEREREWRD